MYAQMLSKSKELTYKCIFSPVVVVHEHSTEPTGFAVLQHAEDQRMLAVSTGKVGGPGDGQLSLPKTPKAESQPNNKTCMPYRM